MSRPHTRRMEGRWWSAGILLLCLGLIACSQNGADTAAPRDKTAAQPSRAEPASAHAPPPAASAVPPPPAPAVAAAPPLPAQPATAAVTAANPPQPEAAIPATTATPAAAKPMQPQLGSGTLSYPDDFQVELLADRLLGRTPPYDDWAAAVVSRRSTDEFADQERLLAEARKPFEAMYQATAGIGSLRVRMRSQFSQYDADNKMYYLTALSPGNSLSFHSGKYRDQRVVLQLENLGEAQTWAMEPAAAQTLLKRHPGRSISLDIVIDLTGAQLRSTGPQLDGRIRKYEIYGNDQLIATRTF